MHPTWPIPTCQELVANWYYYDFVPAIGKKGGIVPFYGTVGSYPGWKQSFIEMVHVQNTPVAYKCRALDAYVTDGVRTSLFKNLGYNEHEYALRIERLEQFFGGEDRQIAYLIGELSNISKMGDSTRALMKTEQSLARYLDSQFCPDPRSTHLASLVLPSLTETMSLEFHQHCLTRDLEPNCESLLTYMRFMLESQRRTAARLDPTKLWVQPRSNDHKKKSVKAKAFQHQLLSSDSEDSMDELLKPRRRKKKTKKYSDSEEEE